MSFDELKARQSQVWGSAPFERIAVEIADVHADLVERLEPLAGTEFLDVACGTGGVAELAAARGAEVTGVDFAPALIETAKARAAEAALPIRYEVGDAEALMFEDASFDVVASSFGVMFAPDQERAAAELARVCRPGGRLGLACWTPGGTIGDFFRLHASFQPPPSAGAGVPVAWGDEQRVRELLGDTFELDLVERSSPQTAESGEQIWEVFVSSFGPTKTLYDSLPPERGEELHRAFVDFYEQRRDGDTVHADREYLVILGRRR